ncbi:ABC-F family ATP-binding cassette domain-containing protein, partial [Corynebacterium sp.]|uniref:ABC-F family ATP-binding cassette domain-containing protein n=1 Tax=Corynebacterium sp. TaxID=1720 RepID=UPI002A90B3F7
ARKELAWLRRGAPARTSKPRYRIEAAEALIANVPAPRDKVELMSFSRQRQGKVVIELEDARIDAPDGRTLVDHLTWRLAPGERIGLVGVNGSGKTTLLRTLAGEYPLTAGKRIEGQTTRIGWLRQELDDLDPERSVLDAVEDVANYVQLGNRDISAAQLAERLGFSPKRQRTPIKDLSGGERRRLQLTRVLMSEPNVLLLDEPTNDLDIDTLQELEDLLDNWPGTLVVISHDRYLIERIADTTYALFGDGTLTNLPGGIQQYIERRAAAAATGGTLDLGQAREKVGVDKQSGLSSQEEREIRKKMNALERRIARAEEQAEAIEATIAEMSGQPAPDFEAIAAATRELGGIREQRDEWEMEWLELGEALES